MLVDFIMNQIPLFLESVKSASPNNLVSQGYNLIFNDQDIKFDKISHHSLAFLSRELEFSDRVVDYEITPKRVWIRFRDDAFEDGYNVFVAFILDSDYRGSTALVSKVKFRKIGDRQQMAEYNV